MINIKNTPYESVTFRPTPQIYKSKDRVNCQIMMLMIKRRALCLKIDFIRY